jgi:Beta-lactamase enzyme family
VAADAGRGRRAQAVAVAVAGVTVVALSLAACGGSGGVGALAGAAEAGRSGAASSGGSGAPGAAMPSAAAAAAAAAAASGGAGSGSGGGASGGSGGGSSSGGVGGGGSSSGGAAGGSRSGGTAEQVKAWRADPFSAGVDEYLGDRAGTVLAAVYDVRTGQTWRLGDGPAQDEASVVKVDILETLLNDGGDGDGGGSGLAAADQGLAQQMIEDSDNDAATSLWYLAGGTAGLAAYDDKAGLTGTTPSDCVVCADFPWPGWGLTTTTPVDQIKLLRQLIKPGPLLTAADRQYALSLLENVTADQAWGISGGVPAGVTVALKNGWLPLGDDNTDWQVNSEGWVSGDGRDYLIAVLSTGNPSEQYGIDTIEELSSQIWAALG